MSLCGLSTAKAQNDVISLTFLPNSTYQNFFNPGISVDAKTVIGIGISNLGASYHNSNIRYNNIFNVQDNKPISIDANRFINSLKDHNNLIGVHFSLDMLRLGVRYKKLFFDLSWRFRLSADIHFSKDLFGIIIHGNGAYLGDDNPANLNVGIELNAFNEYALGVQYDVTDKLTVGVRPKLLSGVVSVILNSNALLYTDENTYEISTDIDANVKASTILDMNLNRISDIGDCFNVESLSINDLLKMKNNIGFGVDLGASYTFNKHIGVALGVYDLGFITWKNVMENNTSKNSVIINDALVDDLDDLSNMDLSINSLLDDAMNGDSLYPGKNYKTTLKTRIMAQAYYEFMPMVRFTVLTQMYNVNKKLYPSLTLAYSGSFFKVIDLTAHYTMSKYTGNTIGAGIGLDSGLINIYAAIDNVLILSKIKASKLEMLTSHSTASLRLGIIFKLGER